MAYLVGAIPTGFWLVKYVKGIDVREIGSGNIGATNVTRALGKKWGAITLLIDLGKSFCVIWIGKKLYFSDPVIALGVGALLLGNAFSCFLKGQGGKGVATMLGIYLALSPLVFCVGALTYGLFRKLSGISAVGSLAAACVLPIASTFFLPSFYVFLSLGISLFVMIRHRKNIAELYQKFCK